MKEVSQLQLHWIDGLIIVGYLMMLVGIGIYHARKQNDLQEFFLAGGEIKWFAVGLSLMAALNSGLDYLMQPAAVIKFGVYVMVGSLSWVVLVPYVFRITLPLYRRIGGISAYEYLEHRFDLRVRILAATIFMLWRIGWMATALYVPSLALSVATGGRVPVNLMIVVIGVVVTFYTMAGGIRAVIWNDVMQFWIMFAGLAATVVICIVNVDGGIATILAQFTRVGDQVQNLPPAGAAPGGLGYFQIPMTLVGVFVAITVARISTYTTDQVMVQRFKTARTTADARRGFLINAVTDTIWMLALSFVGLALFAYFNATLGRLPSWTVDQPDRLFPYFMSLVFPVGLTGLVIAAILAASISSIDSAINSLTSVATVDFVERLHLGRAWSSDPRRLVFVSRVITLLIGAVGVGVALNVAALGTLLEISNKLINSFSGPILGIYFLGMFSRRATANGVLIGGIVGTFVTIYVAFQAEAHRALNVWFGLALDTRIVISFLWPSTFGCLATYACGYLTSLWGRPKDATAVEPWLWANIMRRPPAN